MKDVGFDPTYDWWTHEYSPMNLYRPARHIVFVNIFEDDRKSGLRYHSPQEYIDFIFHLRNVTKGSQNELAFVLYHKSGALETTQAIDAVELDRLRHYFVLHHDEPVDILSEKLPHLWCGVQKLLLDTQVSIDPQPNLVVLSDIYISAIHSDSRFIKTMEMEFKTNCLLENTEISFSFEAANLVVTFSMKRIGIRVGVYRFDQSFSLSAEDNRIVVTPTAYSNVFFNDHSPIQTLIDIRRVEPYGNHEMTVKFEFPLG